MNERIQYVRDLLPIRAVRCQYNWRLVDYYGSCKGEKRRNKKKCVHLIGEYVCNYFQADFNPRFHVGRLKGNARALRDN